MTERVISKQGQQVANSTGDTSRQFENFLAIAIALTAEKNRNKLLEMILSEARRITNGDAGTLYLVDGEHLRYKILHNKSMNTFMGGKGEEITIPPVPITQEYVSGYTALTGKSVNIEDVYESSEFDFSGPRKYDQMTGYKTTSMLVIPLKNHQDKVIGVLQLINAQDSAGQVIPFAPSFEPIVESLASLAAIALTNMQLIEEIQSLFESFVQVMVTAIDAQTPYNATHTQKVYTLSRLIALAINSAQEGPFAQEHFDEDRIYQLTMAGWLHDIGKVATPLEVMNKATRLDTQLPLVLQRVDLAIAQERNNGLLQQLALLQDGKTEEAARVQHIMQVREGILHQAKELIIKADHPGTFIDEQIKSQLERFAQLTYNDINGEQHKLLSPEELTHLTIPRGTLTADERKIMEDHVAITGKMLSKLPFPEKLALVPTFACMHHESLDGKGYPDRLQAEQIPLEARILAIADVFDALTASDRPYKAGMPVEKALGIMSSMAADQKLDSQLLELFKEKKVWEIFDQQA